MSEDEQNAIGRFTSVLGVSKAVAMALVHAGMTSIEEIAYVPIDELREIDKLDPPMVDEVRAKALAYLAIRVK
jgi:N utilization substance protein A